MSEKWLSEKQCEHRLAHAAESDNIRMHYWLSLYYKQSVFCTGYRAPAKIVDAVRGTELGNTIAVECARAIESPLADSTLALYGHFYHNDILIDDKKSDLAAIIDLLEDDLLNDRNRLPYSWGRLLHDRFNDRPELCELDVVQHDAVWELLNGMPIGIFQHGFFVSGPFGIVQSVEHRWTPVRSHVEYFTLDGTRTMTRHASFMTAHAKVVDAYTWIERELHKRFGQPSAWSRPLIWKQESPKLDPEKRYADFLLVLADCVLGQDRAQLLARVLKTDAGSAIRDAIRRVPSMRAQRSLPPDQLSSVLDDDQRLQLLLIASTETIVYCEADPIRWARFG